jgi:hypothetical protein
VKPFVQPSVVVVQNFLLPQHLEDWAYVGSRIGGVWTI